MNKEKYKVTLFTKYFESPTSLSCENIISYAYIDAENISEVKDKLTKAFKISDHSEPIQLIVDTINHA